jgi:hypothetical protein
MAPASSTPNPNKWLNSRPTPFIVQWKRPLASNNELRFDVRTVKCWISLQVNCGLERYNTQLVIILQFKEQIGFICAFKIGDCLK